jgi:hypothetical protein
MKYLVGTTVMDSGQKVIITWSDGTKTKAVYNDTFGYNHQFIGENGNEIKLSNRFIQLKGIKVVKDDEQ